MGAIGGLVGARTSGLVRADVFGLIRAIALAVGGVRGLCSG